MTPATTTAHIIQRMQNEIGLTSDELGIARRIVAQEIEAMELEPENNAELRQAYNDITEAH